MKTAVAMPRGRSVDQPSVPEAAEDPRLTEQHHQLDEDPAVEAAFARLAPGHPEGVGS